jgi:hypothetical protein
VNPPAWSGYNYPKMRLRSAVSLLAVLYGAPALAQGRVLDEGVFTISRTGSPAATESFKIVRAEGDAILATGQLISGSRRVTSSLTTDSVGTPVKYDLSVYENGALTQHVSALAQGGRLSALSKDGRGNESMTEYPLATGKSLVLEEDLVHQSYFITLGKRSGNVQVIEPRGAHRLNLTLSAIGLEPVAIGGRSTTATHYSLGNGLGRRDFWIDSAGRVLRVETSQGLKAVREELPR